MPVPAAIQHTAETPALTPAVPPQVPATIPGSSTTIGHAAPVLAAVQRQTETSALTPIVPPRSLAAAPGSAAVREQAPRGPAGFSYSERTVEAKTSAGGPLTINPPRSPTSTWAPVTPRGVTPPNQRLPETPAVAATPVVGDTTPTTTPSSPTPEPSAVQPARYALLPNPQPPTPIPHPPIIRVSIGRIDVRVTAPLPAASPPRGPVQPAVSLDDYLSGMGGMR